MKYTQTIIIAVLMIFAGASARAQSIFEEKYQERVEALFNKTFDAISGFRESESAFEEVAGAIETYGVKKHSDTFAQYESAIILVMQDADAAKELRNRIGKKFDIDIHPRFTGKDLSSLSGAAFANVNYDINKLADENSGGDLALLLLKEIRLELTIQKAYAFFQPAYDAFAAEAPQLVADTAKLGAKKPTAKDGGMLAGSLIALASELGQNSKAISYYEKFKPLVDAITEPDYVDQVYPALIFAYTAAGNYKKADDLHKRMMQLEDKKPRPMAKKSAVPHGEVMYDMMDEKDMAKMDESIGAGGSGGGSGGGIAKRTVKLTISNLSQVQTGDLVNAFWDLPDFIGASEATFDKNTATMELTVAATMPEQTLVDFLNGREFPGFVIEAQSEGESQISARALGIPREKFNAMMPSFEYIRQPKEPVAAKDILALLVAIRSADASINASPLRSLLYSNMELALNLMAGDSQALAAAPAPDRKAAAAFPEMLAFSDALHGLAFSGLGAYSASLDSFDNANAILAVSPKFPAASRTTEENILSVSLAAGKPDDSKKSAARLAELISNSANGMETVNLDITLANYHYAAGDYDNALENFAAADKLLENYTGVNNARALVLIGEGNCMIMTKKHEDAKKAFSTAAQAAKDAGDSLVQAAALAHLAQVELFTGAYADAQKDSEDALAIADNFEYGTLKWQALYTLARSLDAQENKDAALEKYMLALDVLEKSVDSAVAGPAALSLDAQDIYRYTVALCARVNKVETALQVLDRAKKYQIKDQFDGSKVVFHDPLTRDAVAKINEVKGKMSGIESEIHKQGAQTSQGAAVSIDQLKQKLQDSQRQYIKYVSDLETGHKELAALYRIEPTELVKARKKLPQDLAVVYYLLGDDSLYIFYVRSDSIGFKQVPASTSEFETQVVMFRNYISKPDNAGGITGIDPATFKSSDPESEKKLSKLRNISAKLYEKLIAPIEPELNGIKTLAIIPNGILNFVPYEALMPSADGTGGFLVDRFAIFYVDTLSMLDKDAPGGVTNDVPLYAFGNADGTLPAAEKEVKKIGAVFKNAKEFVRKDATEEKAKDLSEKPGIFHFATHGVLDFTDISQSYILLAPDSGAGDDGRFTIEEVWGYLWSDSKLITLSACNTANGDITVRGKAVHPASAFLNAGAPSVLATLWSVDDAATANLMADFYGNITKMNKANALRTAQLDLKKDPRTAHPFYWAPFTLIGDWR